MAVTLTYRKNEPKQPMWHLRIHIYEIDAMPFSIRLWAHHATLKCRMTKPIWISLNFINQMTKICYLPSNVFNPLWTVLNIKWTGFNFYFLTYLFVNNDIFRLGYTCVKEITTWAHFVRPLLVNTVCKWLHSVFTYVSRSIRTFWGIRIAALHYVNSDSFNMVNDLKLKQSWKTRPTWVGTHGC